MRGKQFAQTLFNMRADDAHTGMSRGQRARSAESHVAAADDDGAASVETQANWEGH